VIRRPSTLVEVLAVALLLAVAGVVFVPAPFTAAPGALIGVPIIGWMMRRDRSDSPPPPDHDPADAP
jgi:hypothetical protein